jgi:hypothetical protein
MKITKTGIIGSEGERYDAIFFKGRGKLDAEAMGYSDFNPEAKCTMCRYQVIELSFGGYTICPWCDTGHPENRPEFLKIN